MKGEKEGADNSAKVDIITETFYRQYRRNKKTSIIVDAVDKNCLAQLTVAQKLNQGVRQWLYIIAGVLFFGSFFCTSKRKNNMIF